MSKNVDYMNKNMHERAHTHTHTHTHTYTNTIANSQHSTATSSSSTQFDILIPSLDQSRMCSAEAKQLTSSNHMGPEPTEYLHHSKIVHNSLSKRFASIA